jgi:hypothetical protein
MTQDHPQTPEPNQPQPPESSTESSAESSTESETGTAAESPTDSATDSTTNDIPLTDERLANALLGDVPPEENQLQSSDSQAEEAVAAIEVSPTAEQSRAETDEETDQKTDQTRETPASVVAKPTLASRESDSVPAPPASPFGSVPESKPSSAPESQAPPANKAVALLRLVGQVWGIVLPIAIIVVRWLWQVLLVTLKWLGEAWKVALPRIRALLPEGWRKLPDWALTTVAIVLLMFILWLTAQLLPGKAPVVARTGDRTPPALNAPAPAQPVVPVPDPALMTNIQTQIAEVTDRYAEGLIQAVQANFQSHLLTVKVGDSWFNLDSGSQAQLANELLKRSHKLDFNTLELTDSEGELLARSPVVGAKMVIYERIKQEG